jgi:hypothetical protein
LRSVGSRQAAIRPVIGTSSAADSIRATPSRKEGIVAAAMYRRPQNVEELPLGRGRFEQAVMVFDPADNEER